MHVLNINVFVNHFAIRMHFNYMVIDLEHYILSQFESMIWLSKACMYILALLAYRPRKEHCPFLAKMISVYTLEPYCTWRIAC